MGTKYQPLREIFPCAKFSLGTFACVVLLTEEQYAIM